VKIFQEKVKRRNRVKKVIEKKNEYNVKKDIERK